MPFILYTYVLLSSASVVVGRDVFMVVHPALLALYLIAAELLR
jgi:hypothetical protein